jgi:serine/threonine-protein kinase RsbW
MNRLTIPAGVGGLKEFCAFVRKGAEGANLSSPDADRLDLILEEVFMNIARHAYAPEQEDVEVGYVSNGPGRLLVEISDAGRPFNPLLHDSPDFSRPLAERPLGGMGIFLVRTMAGSLRYDRAGGRNRLSFMFPVGDEDSKKI